MSVVIVGVNEKMKRQDQDLCAEYSESTWCKWPEQGMIVYGRLNI